MTVLGVGTTTFAGKWFDKFVSTTGATSTSYIFANDVLIATVEGNGNSTSTKFIHGDHLGSTNIVTNASGLVVQVLDYYPYGTKRIETGEDVSDREFIGERFDESSNLSYLNARYYDPARGQFLSQDPVFNEDPRFQNLGNPQSLNSARTMGGLNSGFASGWNRNTQSRGNSISQAEYLADPQMQNSYAYARGNPITNKDPDGNFAVLALPVYAVWTAPEWVPAVAWGIGAAGAYITGDILLRQSGGREYGRTDGIQFPNMGGAPLDPLDPWEGGNWKPGNPKDWKTWVGTGVSIIGAATGIYEAAKNLPVNNRTQNNYNSTNSNQSVGTQGGGGNNQIISGLQRLVSSLQSLVKSLSASQNKRN